MVLTRRSLISRILACRMFGVTNYISMIVYQKVSNAIKILSKKRNNHNCLRAIFKYSDFKNDLSFSRCLWLIADDFRSCFGNKLLHYRSRRIHSSFIRQIIPSLQRSSLLQRFTYHDLCRSLVRLFWVACAGAVFLSPLSRFKGSPKIKLLFWRADFLGLRRFLSCVLVHDLGGCHCLAWGCAQCPQNLRRLAWRRSSTSYSRRIKVLLNQFSSSLKSRLGILILS